MDSMVTARVPKEIKSRACKALETFGVTPSQAINALFEFVATNQRLPDFRSEEQALFENKPRVFDPGTMTPRMRQIIKAMQAIEERGKSIDWGEDAEKPFRELLEESREERRACLLGY